MIIIKLIKESFSFALQAIILNKLRTFLSLLGITIGIFAIISVFTMLDWMEKSIRDSIASLGDNTVYVTKWPWVQDASLKWWDILKWPVPTLDEYEELKDRMVTAEAVSFMVSTGVNVKHRGNVAEDVGFVSTTHDFQEIRSFEIEKGRYFSPLESHAGKQYAILGAELSKALFEGASPLGKKVTVRGGKLTVIGVMKREGMGGISDDGFDNAIMVPVNATRNFVNIRSDKLNPFIIVKAKEGVSNAEFRDDLTAQLRAIRKIKPGQPNNFSLNQASIINQAIDAIFAGINLGGWIIGGFSILVGGFGIANIMFVSVKERTRIIGIQKALGAKKFFILQQFLYESVLLSIVGGLVGLLLVFIGTIVMNRMWDLNVSLTLGNISLALFISGTIGIISGFTPARTASRLDPVNAMANVF